MKCVCGLLFLSVNFFLAETRLIWSNTYTYEAVLSVPGSDIQEPYKVWVDGRSGNSRVDFYNGLVKFYRFRLLGPINKFNYLKIYPETSNSEIKETCLRLQDNSLINNYNSVTYLPQRKFVYKGMSDQNGLNYQIWECTESKIISGYNITKKHIIWVSYAVYNNEIITVPVKYIYNATGGDRGVPIDYFTHDYFSYSPTEIDTSIFDLPEDLPCKDGDTPIDEPVDPLLDYIDTSNEDLIILRDFKRYKKLYRKVYLGSDEEFLRMSIYKSNQRLISSHNRKNLSYTLAVNQFADRTKEELSLLMGAYTVRDDNDDIFDQDEVNVADEHRQARKFILYDTYQSFDWRNYNAVTPAKDQTSLCGACYAFTTASMVESAVYIQGGFMKKMKEVSEQAIVDCSWRVDRFGNYGCEGGFIGSSLSWVNRNGVPFKSDYGPYLAMEGFCHAENMTNKAHIKDFARLPRDIDVIKISLRNRGPLAVSINANSISFMLYSKGVYNNPECLSNPAKTAHSLVLVGYGKENAEEYWLLKNSYGRGWGEDGFIKIAIKDNICGVTNHVYAVTGVTQEKSIDKKALIK